jgi:hypothetical protein
LKVSHHGSANATTKELLDLLDCHKSPGKGHRRGADGRSEPEATPIRRSPTQQHREVEIQWKRDAPTILLVHKDSPRLQDDNAERADKLVRAALQSHPHQENEPERGVSSPDQSTFALIVDQDVWRINGANALSQCLQWATPST